jgi:hypothetical protein
MAFEDISKKAGKVIKATEIEVGSSLTGYVTRFIENANLGVTNVALTLENGEDAVLFPAGNIRYAVQDGKIKIGYLTRFTRNADKMVKGKKSTNFTIEQDFSKSVAANDEMANAGITSDVANIKVNPIKRAGEVAKQVNGK